MPLQHRGPSGAGGDFVVVEDSGEFSYYGSREALLADFEYVGEAPLHH